MKPYQFFYLSWFILVVVMTNQSCSHSETDLEKPTIVLTKPAFNDSIQSSTGKLRIQFVAKDNDELHEVVIRLLDSKDKVLYNESHDVDKATLNYDKEIQLTGLPKDEYIELLVTASDHSGNKDALFVLIYVIP